MRGSELDRDDVLSEHRSNRPGIALFQEREKMTTKNEQAHNDLDELKATIEKLAADVSTMSHSLADLLKARAGRAADDIRDGLKSAAGDISDKSKASKEAIETTVRERPFQSLLAAFSVGLVIALLCRKH